MFHMPNHISRTIDADIHSRPDTSHAEQGGVPHVSSPASVTPGTGFPSAGASGKPSGLIARLSVPQEGGGARATSPGRALPPAARITAEQLGPPHDGIYPGKEGSRYVRMGEDFYQVQYDNLMHAWVAVDPANPHAFYGRTPVVLDKATGEWRPVERVGLRGGTDSPGDPTIEMKIQQAKVEFRQDEALVNRAQTRMDIAGHERDRVANVFKNATRQSKAATDELQRLESRRSKLKVTWDHLRSNIFKLKHGFGSTEESMGSLQEKEDYVATQLAALDGNIERQKSAVVRAARDVDKTRAERDDAKRVVADATEKLRQSLERLQTSRDRYQKLM